MVVLVSFFWHRSGLVMEAGIVWRDTDLVRAVIFGSVGPNTALGMIYFIDFRS